MNWTFDSAERNFSALVGSTTKYYHKMHLCDGRAVYMINEDIFKKLQEITEYLIAYEDEIQNLKIKRGMDV